MPKDSCSSAGGKEPDESSWPSKPFAHQCLRLFLTNNRRVLASKANGKVGVVRSARDCGLRRGRHG